DPERQDTEPVGRVGAGRAEQQRRHRGDRGGHHEREEGAPMPRTLGHRQILGVERGGSGISSRSGTTRNWRSGAWRLGYPGPWRNDPKLEEWSVAARVSRAVAERPEM